MPSRTWLALLLPLLAAGASGEPRTYQVDPARSSLRVSVGKSGLFSFAGHEHEVLATSFSGAVVADAADLSRSTVSLEFPATGLRLAEKGEPPEDVPKVQEKMMGPEVLDAARFPSVTFRSTAVKGKPATGGAYELELTGELGLHGATQSLTLPVHVDVSEGELTASGHLALRQTDYGIKPVSVGGVVKVKNEIFLEFSIVARRQP